MTLLLLHFLQAYERRCKAVRGSKEQKYWKDITVEMMSDEERVGEKWVRHRPSYRSDLFNRFIDKLDGRATTIDRARFPRDAGSPRVKHPPQCAKQWMLSQTTVEEIEENECNSGAELFSNGDSSP